MDNDKVLEILHDHHKDSFEHIREREKQRDRLFLILIALLGLLLFQLQYSLTGVSEISILGAKIDLTKIPGAVVLSTTWTFFLILLVRYYQAAIVIENQYDYLHDLEEHISQLIANPKIYRREGNAYLVKKAQGFRTWIWRFYTIAFPLVVILATARSAWLEYRVLSIPIFHKIYDASALIAAVWLLSLYFLRYGIPKLTVSFPVFEEQNKTNPPPAISQRDPPQSLDTAAGINANLPQQK